MTKRLLASRGLALRGRLVLLLLLALLPAFLVSLYTSLQHRERLAEDAKDKTVLLASLAASHVERVLDSTYHLLALLEGDVQVLAGGAQCEERFEQVLASSNQEFSALARTDANGEIVCSRPQPMRPTRLDKPLLARLENEPFLIREGGVGELSGRPVVVAVQAIRENQRVIGTLAVGVDLQRFADLAERTGLPDGAIFAMINAQGTIVARYPDPEKWIGQSVRDRRGFSQYMRDSHVPGGFVGPSLDGVSRVLGYAPLEVGGARFITVVGLSENELATAADTVLYNNLIGFALAAGLALAAAALVGEFTLRRPIERMRLTAHRITGGDLAARVALDHAPGELGGLARSIDEMAVGLQSREQRLAGLSRRILEVQELERRTLAIELHDEIGQSLTALKLMLQRHRQADDCSDIAAIDELMSVADRTLQTVRSLSLDLRPSMLDHLGLSATLRWYVDREAERSGYHATCVIQPERLRLATSLETTIFRIVQEALTNVVRHARATSVSVRLLAADGRIELRVRDNGGGFDVAAARARAQHGQSLGLLGMEERAVLAGGTLHLSSGPQGTEVRAVFTGDPL